MKTEAQRFARVVVPSPLKQSLIYTIPSVFDGQISAGMRVLVPIGKRKVIGVVFDLLSKTSRTETKEIIALCDDRPVLDTPLLQLCQWIARYYLATPGEVLATLLPPNLRGETRRIVIANPANSYRGEGLEHDILETLRQHNGKASVKRLTRQFSGASQIYRTLARLESRGAIEIREQLGGRHRKKIFLDESSASSSASGFQLSCEQRRVWATIEYRLTRGGFETFLLHGVTGSGKTEVYLRAMERVRETGRQSLILIPEISLTPQLTDRLNARFPGRVGILHSGLTAAERWAYWWHIVRGHVDVVVGARSAVFAPLPNLGLIVVDEEHDPSYKQEEGLTYNGRDVAVVRGKLSPCTVILGSATPALESYRNSLEGRYTLLELKTRIQQRPLPQIEIIDLRQRALTDDHQQYHEDAAGQRPDKSTLISPRLAELIRENFHKSRQTLIFLNRRGFSPFLQCRLCGYVLRCSYCSVTLTLHLKQKRLSCHHCNFSKIASDICPGCGNLSLIGIGAGTEQIQRILNQLLPEARVARMDRDTTSKRGSHRTLLRSWENGEIDILVGTQMITKGHDVVGVTLVGAVLADLSLNVPDFRASERTFQLLSQVAGRSGRGNDPGLMIVQTYAPDHYVIEHVTNHDYKGFFAAEAEFRRALSYPPFGRLVHLRLEGPDANEVEAQAKKLAASLRSNLDNNLKLRGQIDVLGPAPAPIPKLRNRYRWQMLLKGQQASALRELADAALLCLPPSRRVRIHIDVDPYSML